MSEVCKLANELRDWRVKSILLEMIAGTWASTRRAPLAEQWECSIQTVEEYARAAGIAVKALASPDAELMRANMLATIEKLREEALQPQPIIGKDGEIVGYRKDISNALAACRDIAKLYGLNAPERRALAVSGADSWPSALRDELSDPENKAPLPQ